MFTLATCEHSFTVASGIETVGLWEGQCPHFAFQKYSFWPPLLPSTETRVTCQLEVEKSKIPHHTRLSK